MRTVRENLCLIAEHKPIFNIVPVHIGGFFRWWTMACVQDRNNPTWRIWQDDMDAPSPDFFIAYFKDHTFTVQHIFLLIFLCLNSFASPPPSSAPPSSGCARGRCPNMPPDLRLCMVPSIAEIIVLLKAPSHRCHPHNVAHTVRPSRHFNDGNRSLPVRGCTEDGATQSRRTMLLPVSFASWCADKRCWAEAVS